MATVKTLLLFYLALVSGYLESHPISPRGLLEVRDAINCLRESRLMSFKPVGSFLTDEKYYQRITEGAFPILNDKTSSFYLGLAKEVDKETKNCPNKSSVCHRGEISIVDCRI